VGSDFTPTAWSILGDKLVQQKCNTLKNAGQSYVCSVAFYSFDGKLLNTLPQEYPQTILPANNEQVTTTTGVLPLMTLGHALHLVNKDGVAEKIQLSSPMRSYFAFGEKVLVQTKNEVHVYSDKGQELFKLPESNLQEDQYIRHALSTADGYALVVASKLSKDFEVQLYAKDGSLQSSYIDSGDIYTPPVLLRNGDIVLRKRKGQGDGEAVVKVLSSNGNEKASIVLGKSVYSGYRERDTLPKVDANNNVLIFGEDAKIYAISPSGQSRVVADTFTETRSKDGDISSAGFNADPVVQKNQKTFFAGKNMYVLDEQNRLKARHALPSEVNTNATALSENAFFFGSIKGNTTVMQIVSNSGKVLASLNDVGKEPDPNLTPLLLPNGKVLVKDVGQNTYFIDVRPGKSCK
jgi:hypothetical protein